MSTRAGVSMRMDLTRVVLKRGGKGRPQALSTSDIPEVRRLLRTEMSVDELAAHFGISPPAFRNFVKRRQICDLAARRRFAALQRSIEADEARGIVGTESFRPHSSDVEQPHCRRTRADSSPAAGTISDRTSVPPKADVRATAAASPVAAVATLPDLSGVASSSSESVTVAEVPPDPTVTVTSNSVAADVCRGAPALTGVPSLDLPAAPSDVAGLSMVVPAGKKLVLCRVERADKNQIVLRTMAPISTAANSGATEADDMPANVLDGVQTRNENKTGSKA